MATTRVGIKNVIENNFISFENEPKDPLFSGFLLRSYVAGEPKDGKAVDTIVCDIIGKGTTPWGAIGDALDKLRWLKRTVTNAGMPGGHYRAMDWVQYWPVGAIYAAYSQLLGGSVSVPSADYLNTKAIISDVVITIVREGRWRVNDPSVIDALITPTWTHTDQWWNSTPVTAAGDMPAPVSIVTAKAAGDIYRTLIVSYRSKLMNPLDYNSAMIEEAETWTMGTDTSAQANAVASNGNVAKCTFTTTATNAVRVSKSSHARRGTYRIFARVWCDSSTTVEFFMTLARRWGTFKGQTVQASLTVPVMFDLGAFQFTQQYPVSDINTAIVPTQPLSFNVRRVSGAGGCYIDGFWMMPCDEGFLRFNNTIAPARSNYALLYDNTMNREQFGTVDIFSNQYVDPLEFTNGTGRMMFQPGAGQLQMLFGYQGMEQSFSLSGLGISTLSLRYVRSYNTPFGTP
jgi:hypothetical protein